MKGKRAQAAMEFLMTYGWAILIILVAMAALAYFGVLNPTRYVSDRCTLPMPLTCGDFYVNATHVQFELVNGESSVIKVTKIEMPGFGSGGCALELAGGQSIASGAKHRFTVGCQQDATADKKKTDLKVTYSSTSGIEKTTTGEIYSSVN